MSASGYGLGIWSLVYEGLYPLHLGPVNGLIKEGNFWLLGKGASS